MKRPERGIPLNAQFRDKITTTKDASEQRLRVSIPLQGQKRLAAMGCEMSPRLESRCTPQMYMRLRLCTRSVKSLQPGFQGDCMRLTSM